MRVSTNCSDVSIATEWTYDLGEGALFELTRLEARRRRAVSRLEQ
jgi:hypothetical protein